jgi:hypothetical protein
VNNYRFSDSGIVTEAIAFNKRLISSSLPFIGPTFGSAYASEVVVNDWTTLGLAKKMVEVLNKHGRSKNEFDASIKAKKLCSPTNFMMNLLG